ncbi:hypothetical protein E5093_14900 [Acinetobacter indicus]|nr:hypothetical protein E5093_14900 [Acinetobacter indicus]QOW51770.1 hypothetical protein G0030_00415 [Acinetobacter indicus]
MSYDYQHIQVKPINGRIGAEIQGIQLSSQLAQAVIQEINQALSPALKSTPQWSFSSRQTDNTGLVKYTD